jgi:hypothetical protein
MVTDGLSLSLSSSLSIVMQDEKDSTRTLLMQGLMIMIIESDLMLCASPSILFQLDCSLNKTSIIMVKTIEQKNTNCSIQCEHLTFSRMTLLMWQQETNLKTRAFSLGTIEIHILDIATSNIDIVVIAAQCLVRPDM